ncbi:MAG: SDR family oxidoreductase [Dysgonamonadaceae bacterium]|jgi:NAD(P)-dependent dehydrogenase (short-subunit alcohol dehydrogenase family)|nr:SDR family oxidoreductase [Dysgonamonadaceae bacterium]MDD4247404.1 SDR family oxidoreductase [Dysgonamonadaceae bacterium]MDD4606658.1 SDR family oxidoreductase [Dysgonamonadaceae bacterium]
MYELFNVSDKVVVITGGTGVLGAAMVEYLAQHGAKIVVLARNKERGDKLIEKVRSKGGDAIFLVTDVNNKEILEKNKKDILAKYKKIDVLINGAGGNMPGATIGPDQTIFDLDIDEFKTVVDLNLLGTVLPSIVFGSCMIEQKKGSIINISSEAALRPLTRVVGYGASKAAVTNFTKYLAIELATKFGDGMRVNAIAPGFFITEQNRSLLTQSDGSFTDRGKAIIAHTPFGRFGEPDELLGTLHWLVSDASKFVTGTLTVVDGGFDAFSI